MNKNKLKKILKIIINNKLTRGLGTGVVIGLISGVIVTFLFSTPKISLNNTSVRIEGDMFYFDFIYENKGESPAVNVEYSTHYLTIYKKK